MGDILALALHNGKSCNHSYVNFLRVFNFSSAFHAQMLIAPTQGEERISQIQKYSSRESSVLAVQLEQTFDHEQRDHKLAKRQSGAEAARLADNLDAVASRSVDGSRP